MKDNSNNKAALALLILMLAAYMLQLRAYAEEWQCDALQHEYKLSDYQMYVMHKSFKAGKERDMGYSLAAIAFKESSAGLFNRNPNDPSASPFHVLASHVLHKFELENSPANIDMAMDMLESNFDFSAMLAMDVLEWWLNRHNGDWLRAWRSYNQGHYWLLPEEQRVRSWNYAVEVRAIVRLMQRECGWDE